MGRTFGLLSILRPQTNECPELFEAKWDNDTRSQWRARTTTHTMPVYIAGDQLRAVETAQAAAMSTCHKRLKE